MTCFEAQQTEVFGSGDIDHPESLYSSHFGSERKSQFQDGRKQPMIR